MMGVEVNDSVGAKRSANGRARQSSDWRPVAQR
jgi:hypothetical protein